MVSRLERTHFAQWCWTVDRPLLAAVLALMLAGVVLSLAASPPVAVRLGLDHFYFVWRHILYVVPTLAVLLATSFLGPGQVRRLALLDFLVSLPRPTTAAPGGRWPRRGVPGAEPGSSSPG